MVEKNSRTNDEGSLDSPSNLVISLSKPPKLPFVMVRFTKSVYNDISRTLSKNYHTFLRSYNGTMQGIIFFRHVFQFCRFEKPINDTFVVDSCDTYHRNLSPFLCKRHGNLVIPQTSFFILLLCTLHAPIMAI